MLVAHNPLSVLIYYHNISRDSLSKFLNISVDTLYYYESDGIDIPDDILDNLCFLFNVSKSFFLSWRGSK